MHQPIAEPRPCLYYRYQVHQAAPAHADHDLQVLVVGAGPIGLVTALGLAQQGVRVVVLESELQVSEGSRAIVFTRRSLEILQQAGVADRITAKGLPWRFGNSFYRGQRVYRMEAPHREDDRFFPMTNLQQQHVEEYLLQALAAFPHAQVRWGHKVSRLLRNIEDEGSDDGAGAAGRGPGVTLEIDTPGGTYVQQAPWVVAADGARSPLRTACGLKLEGAAYEGRFVIADIRIDLPLPTERLAFFDPPWNPGNTVLMHREPDSIWRVDYQLPPGETPEQALEPASLKARIDAQLALIGHAGAPWELDWCSVYSARALTLPRYVHGRIAFAGDAAHLLPIFGVRGANTGFQDAQNLAWKLAATVQGRAGPGLMSSYSHERVAAAREIVQEAGKSTRFMTPPTRGFRMLRNAVLSLSLTQEFVRPLYHWRTSRPHDYLDSPLNAAQDDSPAFRAGPASGAPLPNYRWGEGYLLDHLCGEAAGHFSLIVDDPATLGLWRSTPAIRQQGAAALTLAVPWPCEVAAAPAPNVQALVVPVELGQSLGLRGAGSALLVRPDQHVCARWHDVTPSRLQAALRQALGHAR
ncbi:MAG: FAD-dependent monooxygenase [Betaproteobacteria bacterium]